MRCSQRVSVTLYEGIHSTKRAGIKLRQLDGKIDCLLSIHTTATYSLTLTLSRSLTPTVSPATPHSLTGHSQRLHWGNRKEAVAFSLLRCCGPCRHSSRGCGKVCSFSSNRLSLLLRLVVGAGYDMTITSAVFGMCDVCGRNAASLGLTEKNRSMAEKMATRGCGRLDGEDPP